MRDLEKKLDEESFDFLKMKEGDKVVGIIRKYRRVFKGAWQYLVCIIEDEQRGKVTMCLNNKSLLMWFKKLNPKIGERIGIKCIKINSNGIPFFRVVMDREEQELKDFNTAKLF